MLLTIVSFYVTIVKLINKVFCTNTVSIKPYQLSKANRKHLFYNIFKQIFMCFLLLLNKENDFKGVTFLRKFK